MPVQMLAPEMDQIVPMDLDIERLGEGFGGTNGPAEGPVWWGEEGYLLFSDIHNDRIVKWSPEDGAGTFLSPCDRTNGLTRDPHRGASWPASTTPDVSGGGNMMAVSPSSPTATEVGS